MPGLSAKGIFTEVKGGLFTNGVGWDILITVKRLDF